jgi:hypothetical protein
LLSTAAAVSEKPTPASCEDDAGVSASEAIGPAMTLKVLAPEASPAALAVTVSEPAATAVMFNAPTLRGLAEGRVHCTYRRWTVVRPKIGSRFTTRDGVVEITSIDHVEEAELEEADAYEAGFSSRQALLRWTAGKGDGELYRIGITLVGPDPRAALRSTDQLNPAEVAALEAKLDRMDRAADRPWTREVLRQIRRSPGVVSTELAAEAGQARAYYKIRVRRLKALGLTESLEVGYLLSPRGSALLDAISPDLG